MTYKKYKIINKIADSDCIKFELNDNIEFSSGKQNFIFCPNEPLFKNYQIGEEIGINLIDGKHISVEKITKNILEEDAVMNDYISQENTEEEKRQIQAQEQIVLLVSAYDKKAAHKLFRGSLKWLEKYIGVVYSEFYPN